MQGTAEFHDQIPQARLEQAQGVFDDATALDTTVHMLNAHPTAGQRVIGRFLLLRQLLFAGFLGRHQDLDLGQRKGQKAQVLQELAPGGQGIGGGVGEALIMEAAVGGLTEEQNRERRIDQQQIFHGMALLLAAITARLLSGILGTPDPPLGPIMSKRGGAGGAGTPTAGGAGATAAGELETGSAGGSKAAAASAETPNRSAKAVSVRDGVSPKAVSAAWSTGSSTCSH